MSNARPYAKALFAKAQQHNRINDVAVWLHALADVFARDKVVKLLADPRVGNEKIVDECLRVLGDKISDEDKNFLRLLAENKCLAIVPAILAIYQRLQLASLNKTAIEVISAKNLTEPQCRALQKTLEHRYRGAVELTYQVDPSLLGGMVLRIGDKVIDGSIKEQLHQLNQSINEYA